MYVLFCFFDVDAYLFEKDLTFGGWQWSAQASFEAI